jgi:hypothetical protein
VQQAAEGLRFDSCGFAEAHARLRESPTACDESSRCAPHADLCGTVRGFGASDDEKITVQFRRFLDSFLIALF